MSPKAVAPQSTLFATAFVLITTLTVASLHPVLASGAQAAPCTQDLEPNDTVEQAIPHESGCVSGKLSAGDQDVFLWTVPETTDPSSWTLSLTGIAGSVTGLKFLETTATADGQISAGAKIYELASAPNTPGVSQAGMAFRPGRYIVGISASNGEGAYQFAIEAEPAQGAREAEPNDDHARATALSLNGTVRGDAAESEDVFQLVIDKRASARRFHIDVSAHPTSGLVLQLEKPDRTILLRHLQISEAVFRLPDLALNEGTYFLRVSRAALPAPYFIRTLPAGPRVAGREEEPNDDRETASLLVPWKRLSAQAGRTGDTDYFAIVVDDALAGRRLSLSWNTPAQDGLSFCLKDSANTLLACRRGEDRGLFDLELAQGTYFVQVSAGYPFRDYDITLQLATARGAGFETEPNDFPATPTKLLPDATLQGQLAGRNDTDVFALDVSGDAKLWNFSAAGAGLYHLKIVDANNGVVGSGAPRSGGERIDVSDVYLLPGRYLLTLSGQNAVYSLTSTPLGPPDASSEREPNNMPDLAHRLRFGASRTGKISDLSDVDLYRFSLAAFEHVALELEPPEGGELRLTLEWGHPSPRRPDAHGLKQPTTYEAWLAPGDYQVTLSPGVPSEGRYRITLKHLDPFNLPPDQEPNDSPVMAIPFPTTLKFAGQVGDFRDQDWFLLPAVASDTSYRLTSSAGLEIGVLVGDASEPTWTTSGQDQMIDVSVGQTAKVGLRGTGAYELALYAGSQGPREPPGQLPLEISIDLGGQPIAPFWPRAQRIEGQISLRNTGAEPLSLSLAARSSHFAYRPELPRSDLMLGPGSTETLPISVQVAPDAWTGDDIQVAVRASTTDGRGSTSSAGVSVDPSALPLREHVAFAFPEPLLGGFNVAALSIAGIPVLDGKTEDENKGRALLFDGLMSTGGLVFDAAQAPAVVTVAFAAGKAWPIHGMAIHPQVAGGVFPAEQIREFEFLLSQDGTTFEPALRGVVTMLPMEQAFVLDQPRLAKAARLKVFSNHADNMGRIGLSEWKVITSPQATWGSPLNIAAPDRGGHIVWSNPTLATNSQELRWLLEPGGKLFTTKTDPKGKVTWVLGFNETRAAQIESFEWEDGPGEPADRRPSSVELAVSTDSPLGPWKTIGTWQLDPTLPTNVQTLAQPEWARFVKFTATGKVSADLSLPHIIRVFEPSVDQTYRSILGEWGMHNATGIFERLNPPAIPADVQILAGDARERAAALQPGQTAAGEVRLGGREDWYSVVVPEGMNTLGVEIQGNPSVDIEAGLEDEAGRKIPLRTLSGTSATLSLEARPDPGKYYIHVIEPPHQVAIAYDTSLSLAAFAPIIARAQHAFAEGVSRQREFINFINFGASYLLEEWSDDPWVLQGAVVGAGFRSSSSDLEATLLTASEGLAKRSGARAIILITDADTDNYAARTRQWEELTRLRPRIFSAHIGAGVDPLLEKNIMLDLAAANGGQYTSARTQAEMDVIVERAAAWLRRPARYWLTAQVSAQSPPAPGSIMVSDEAGGEVTPNQVAATTGSPGPTDKPGATSPVVEIILDASGSMLQRLEGKTRIDIAKAALSEVVGKTLQPNMPVALRIFGDQKPRSCDTRLALPLGPLNRESVLQLIANVRPRNLAKTPIAASLQQVANDLKDASGPRTVVLITDGEETCGGDPQAEIEVLRQAGVEVKVNIVGFAVEDEALRKTFQEWAETGGGEYFDARRKDELGAAIEAAVSAPFRVVDASGSEVATSRVGSSVSIPPGLYRVEIGANREIVFDNVEVVSGETTVIDARRP